MQDFYVKVGDAVTFAKTVGETDIYLFAGITGDFSVNHVNEQYMAHSKFGRRIAHGALFIGDTVTLTYTVAEVDPQKRQSLADIEVVNQNGVLVAVARHILRWVENAG